MIEAPATEGVIHDGGPVVTENINVVPCARCRENPGTVRWGESQTMIVRGYFQMWCERCATEVQLGHAKERAKVIPRLERKLRKLGGPAKLRGASSGRLSESGT